MVKSRDFLKSPFSLRAVASFSHNLHPITHGVEIDGLMRTVAFEVRLHFRNRPDRPHDQRGNFLQCLLT